MTECVVLPGLYGLFVQGLLFLCCVGVLIFKKFTEGSQRSWFEFGLDSSKQIIGSGWIHVMNLACATILSHQVANADECEWYWTNIMIDTTLGVAIEYWLLRPITLGLKWMFCDTSDDFEPGDYGTAGGRFQIQRYAKQLLAWLVVVTSMKAIMVILMLIASSPLTMVARFVLRPFLNEPSLKLLVVMILTPLCMNAFQFWVVDNLIKKRKPNDYEMRAFPPYGDEGGPFLPQHQPY